MKKIIFILMFLPVICQARLVRNILTPGKDNFFQLYDFNAKFNLVPFQDTVVLDGVYGDIDFKIIRGITFVNEKGRPPARIKSFTVYPGGSADVALDGSMDPSLKYGIIISGSRFGFNVSATGLVKMNACEMIGNATGVKIVHDTVSAHVYNYVNAVITNNHIRGIKLEGMYIGSDKSVGPFITGTISGNRVDSTGWDAIQCRVGYFVIEDNVCDSIGLTKATGQDHGILIGSNTNGSIIRRNKVTNVNGYGIFNNGFGSQIIECNDVQGAIMIQSLSAATDFQNTGKKSFMVTGNTIRTGSAISLFAYFDKLKGVPMSVTYSNNNASGPASIQPGVQYIGENNGPSVVPACSGKQIWKKIVIYSDGSYQEL